MVDVVDRATRSRMMSGIRGANTQPELFLRKALFATGLRYRLHDPRLPGKPDIVLPRYQAVIFVNGCFWHGHDCRYFRLPSTRRKFWREKISGNRRRDAHAIHLLRDQGWRVMTVWECAFRGVNPTKQKKNVEKIVGWVKSKRRFGEIRGKRGTTA